MPDPAILYNVAIEGPFPSILIEWGATPGWLETYEAELKQATKLTLIPKPGIAGLPLVTVNPTGDRRWILFSRVYGEINKRTGQQMEIRLYCLGWQTTFEGDNLKLVMWIYPNGVIEAADEPTLVGLYLRPATLKPTAGWRDERVLQ